MIRWAGGFAASVLALSLLASGTGPLSPSEGPLLISRNHPHQDDGLRLDVPGDGQGFGNGPFGPILDTALLAPGYSVTADVDALNADGPPGRLTLRALDIADVETACSPAEAPVDTTCGTGSGELRPDVRFDISADVDGNGMADHFVPVLLDATIDDLAAGEIVLNDEDMGAGDIWTVRITARLPASSGNETMTDRLDFDLRWTLTETPDGTTSEVVTGSGPGTSPSTLDPAGGISTPGGTAEPAPGPDVLGEHLERAPDPAPSVEAAPAVPAQPTGWLPRTGAGAVALQLALALGLILAGLVNRFAGRRRRSS